MTRNQIKKFNKIQNDMDIRMIKAMEILGDRNLSKEEQKKFEEIINPNHQNEMTTMNEIENKYPNIPSPFINVQLQISGYLQLLGDKLYPKKPYSDYYLAPVFQNGEFKGSNAILVVSQEVEKNLQEFCDKELYKDWELHS